MKLDCGNWFPTALLFLAAYIPVTHSAELSSVALPRPRLNGGKPLMQALQQRQTSREFKSDELPPQVLADLLWAAFGINRPATGQRTAPSAMNSQEVELYVALPQALYRYEPKSNQLQPVIAGDFRSKTSGQPFATNAPLTLLFVADLERLAKARTETRLFYAQFDAGCISQNVYLYCASAGLGTVVHDLDRSALAAAMKLRPEQQLILAQAVGYPKPGSPSGGEQPGKTKR